MKYYLIAGERSGDLHASNLMKEILKEDPKANFRFWGGDKMQAVGGTMVKHYQETAFMGLMTVILNLHKVFGFLRKCQKDITQYQPDVVILVDYAGFNLRIAKFLKKYLSIPSFFYISPKLWAWNTGRARNIKANVDKMFVIFPFEVEFYRQFEYEVDYVGNPLLDSIAQFQPDSDFKLVHQLGEEPIIALLPGSRKQEVKKILSIMLTVYDAFPKYQFVIAGVSNLPRSIYQKFVGLPRVKVVYDKTYNLLTQSEAAIVTSGTATLETALFEIPQVVVYKTSPLTYWAGKQVIKVPYISLVNLILEREVVKELIQKEFNTENLTSELQMIVEGGSKRLQLLEDYQELKNKMGEEGASQKAARLMVGYLKNGMAKNLSENIKKK